MIKRPILAAKEFYERLKPEGRFFISGYNGDFERNFQKLAFQENGKFYFITSELSEKDGKRYFSVREMDKQGNIKTIGPYCELICTRARTLLARHLGCMIKDLK